MNFYNPYYYMMPTATSGLGRGLLGGAVRGGINWSSILNGAQRTLGLVNQAIPMVRNAKTMFKVMNEFKKVETPNTNANNNNISNNVNNASEINTSNDENIQMVSNGGPTFFV